MAEQKTEKLNIRLHVYDEEIPVKVLREEEEFYRAAAKHITERYNVYAANFKGKKSDHSIALMTLIDIALQLQKEKRKNDTAPFTNILSKLTADIEEVLEEKK